MQKSVNPAVTVGVIAAVLVLVFVGFKVIGGRDNANQPSAQESQQHIPSGANAAMMGKDGANRMTRPGGQMGGGYPQRR